ncbi:MAG: isoprenylcysteine carboxylmethyltransferase family protein [Bacteroidota bacterium]
MTSPGIPFPPPTLYLVLGCVFYGLDKVVSVSIPISLPPHIRILVIILSLVVLSLVVLYTEWMFKTHNTSILPWTSDSRLITTGPFAYSRNPVYLVSILLSVAMAAYLESAWVLLSGLVTMWIIDRMIIPKEERYLEQEFGEAYLRYKKKVRRWI